MAPNIQPEDVNMPQNDAPSQTEQDQATEDHKRAEALVEALRVAHTQEIEQLKAENTTLKENWARAAAETENIRKRATRDVEEASKFAVSSFAKSLIEVAENLHRAIESIPEESRTKTSEFNTLFVGIEMTLKELSSAFEKQGITRISPFGEKFDHNLHQAVAHIETNDHAAGSIIQVMQAGYTLHGRLLRPAMVTVAKAAPDNVSHNVDTTA